jgi:hypothetical protein
VSTHPPVSCFSIYNGQITPLEEAIYSFLRQDYPGKKELIVLNDQPEQTLRFDHPEVQVINLTRRFRTQAQRANAAVSHCTHNYILSWWVEDISLPHRLSVSLRTYPQPCKPARIYVWENNRLGGPYHNLFHQGEGWPRAQFDSVQGFRHKETVVPQLSLLPHSDSRPLTPAEIFYIYRGPAPADPPPGGVVHLSPHWRVDYDRLAKEQQASYMARRDDRIRTELLLPEQHRLNRYGFVPEIRYETVTDRQLLYVVIPKVACTSIKTALLSPDDLQTDVHSWRTRKIVPTILAEHRDFFKFAFVRNPFERLGSGYRNKIINGDRAQGYRHIIPLHSSFNQFVTLVLSRPDSLTNHHFQSQVSALYRDGKLLVDFLGRFETLADDWEHLATRFKLMPRLPHRNPSATVNPHSAESDYRAYYHSEELVQLVYERYQADIEAFGYQTAYKELLAYVRKKNKSTLKPLSANERSG